MNEIIGYLSKLQTKLRFDEYESSAETSTGYLKQKLWAAFQNKLQDVIIFGSYDRKTILSPTIDKEADIDVMVIFKAGEFKPQTYLDQLRKFSEKTYPRSEIFPDFPTVVIELTNLKFELVPAYWYTPFLEDKKLMIPGSPSKEVKWIPTDPSSFKTKLTKKNSQLKENLIPLILILKYWNCLNNYPFLSYNLEKFIVERVFEKDDLKSMLFATINGLSTLAINEKQKEAVRIIVEKKRRLILMEKERLNEYLLLEMQSFLP